MITSAPCEDRKDHFRYFELLFLCNNCVIGDQASSSAVLYSDLDCCDSR